MNKQKDKYTSKIKKINKELFAIIEIFFPNILKLQKEIRLF